MDQVEWANCSARQLQAWHTNSTKCFMRRIRLIGSAQIAQSSTGRQGRHHANNPRRVWLVMAHDVFQTNAATHPRF